MFTGDLRELAEDLPTQFGSGSVTLLPYQVEGVAWLLSLIRAHSGGILAMDMGMGKTVQVCAALSLFYRESNSFDIDECELTPVTDKSVACDAGSSSAEKLAEASADKFHVTGLVLCNPAMLSTWQEHLVSICPEYEVLMFHGDRRQAIFDAYKGDRAMVLLTTYDLLRRSVSQLRRPPVVNDETTQWNFLVADEAQAFKNSDTGIFKAVKQVDAACHILLTATPILNHYEELWSLMNVIEPDVLGSLTTFRTRYGDIIKSRSTHGTSRSTRVKQLKQKVSPYILRRMKPKASEANPTDSDASAVTALGTFTELQNVVAFFALSEAQWDSYKTCLASIFPIDMGSVMLNISKLLNVCQAIKAETPKLQFLSSVLPLWIRRGHSVLLFSKWRKTLDLIEEMVLRPLALEWCRLDGSQTPSVKQRNVQTFQTSKRPMIMILTTKAGGTGLTLTKANRVIVLDPSWCAADDSQAIGRAHRVGQKRNVKAYRLFYAGTIEEHMFVYQIHKTILSTAVLADCDVKNSLTFCDVKFLFRLVPAAQSSVKVLLDSNISDETKAAFTAEIDADLAEPSSPVPGLLSVDSDDEEEAAPLPAKRVSVAVSNHPAPSLSLDTVIAVYPLTEIISQREHIRPRAPAHDSNF